MSKRKPKRPGRPSLGDHGLSKVISLKVSEVIHEQWRTAAARENQTLGEWIRAACELAIARGSTR